MQVAKHGPSLAYVIEDGIRWLGESEHTADSLSAAAEDATGAVENGDAKSVVRAFLADGLRHLSKDLIEYAGEQGIAERTLKAARRKLGVQARKREGDGAWECRLFQLALAA